MKKGNGIQLEKIYITNTTKNIIDSDRAPIASDRLRHRIFWGIYIIYFNFYQRYVLLDYHFILYYIRYITIIS